MQKKLEYFIKSNSILNRYSDLGDIIIAHINALEKVFNCKVTVIVENQVYGKNAAPVICNKPVMTRFELPGCVGVSINEGAVLFWSDNIDEFGMVAASQMDIVITNQLLQQKLYHLATRDGLTGLYNRREFMNIFTETLESGVTSGFLLMDIDKFKTYNDNYGHPAGDELLQQLSQLLQNITRKTDVVGRLGGEEFGILVKEVNEESLSVIAEKIRSIVQDDLVPPKTKRPVTLSIGGSLFPKEGMTIDEVYKTADERLYIAKESGRNQVILQG